MMGASKETTNKTIVNYDSNTCSLRPLFRVVRCQDLVVADTYERVWRESLSRKRNRNGKSYCYANNIGTATHINEGNYGMGLGMTVTL